MGSVDRSRVAVAGAVVALVTWVLPIGWITYLERTGAPKFEELGGVVAALGRVAFAVWGAGCLVALAWLVRRRPDAARSAGRLVVSSLALGTGVGGLATLLLLPTLLASDPVPVAFIAALALLAAVGAAIPLRRGGYRDRPAALAGLVVLWTAMVAGGIVLAFALVTIGFFVVAG